MIKFYIDQNYKDVFPSPQRSTRYLPEYFKKLKPQMDSDPQSGTAKRCVPFIEASTAGYIIPSWCDMFVTAEDGEINISFPNNFPMPQTVETHSYDQLKDHTISHLDYGKNLLKFINPWIIETPPGVSCLFTNPMNHFESRFTLINGIVDTDTYYNQINFPFIWTGGDGEFFIHKGTPLVQVFPFVRYEFNDYKIEIINESKKQKTKNLLGTVMKNGYRRYFWHKRKK